MKKGEVVVNTAAITNMCTLSRLVAGSTYVFSVVAVSNMSTSPPVMLTIARFPSTGLTELLVCFDCPRPMCSKHQNPYGYLLP